MSMAATVPGIPATASAWLPEHAARAAYARYMSAVLHPVGPEPAQTYWVRRLVVMVVAVILLAIVITLLGNVGRGQQAEPAVLPRATPSPTMSASRPTTASTAVPDSSGAVPSAATSTSPAPASTQPSNSVQASRGKVAAAQPQTCPASLLRATLTGGQQLKPTQPTTFHLSVINGSTQTCVVAVSTETFELKIYSGTDRIWSSKDCASLVKPVKAIVESEKSIEWQMTWNGHRSARTCKIRPEIPRPGTYFATAQLDGARPVQLRILLHR